MAGPDVIRLTIRGWSNALSSLGMFSLPPHSSACKDSSFQLTTLTRFSSKRTEPSYSWVNPPKSAVSGSSLPCTKRHRLKSKARPRRSDLKNIWRQNCSRMRRAFHELDQDKSFTSENTLVETPRTYGRVVKAVWHISSSERRLYHPCTSLLNCNQTTWRSTLLRTSKAATASPPSQDNKCL